MVDSGWLQMTIVAGLLAWLARSGVAIWTERTGGLGSGG